MPGTVVGAGMYTVETKSLHHGAYILLGGGMTAQRNKHRMCQNEDMGGGGVPGRLKKTGHVRGQTQSRHKDECVTSAMSPVTSKARGCNRAAGESRGREVER